MAIDVKHVYLGANQSFNPTTNEEYDKWEKLALSLLAQGLWVTLDFDIKYITDILEMGLNEKNKFIAMISAKLPYIAQFNYNATLKIDDIDFDKSNPGVWCHGVHNLMSRDTFTDWNKYTNDVILK